MESQNISTLCNANEWFWYIKWFYNICEHLKPLILIILILITFYNSFLKTKLNLKFKEILNACSFWKKIFSNLICVLIYSLIFKDSCVMKICKNCRNIQWEFTFKVVTVFRSTSFLKETPHQIKFLRNQQNVQHNDSTNLAATHDFD